jgi:hypothetical protein
MTWPLLLQDLEPFEFEPANLPFQWFVPPIRTWIHHTGDARGLLFWPRVNNLLWTTILIVAIWLLLGRYGELTAFLGAAFIAFCPNLLAHSALATTDSSAVVCYALATIAFWRLTRCVSLRRLLTAGVAVSAVALCKFSGLLIMPVCIVLAIARVWIRAPVHWRIGNRSAFRRRSQKSAAMLFAFFGVSFLTYFLIWTVYGFRYSAGPPDAKVVFNPRTGANLTPDYWRRPPAKLVPGQSNQVPAGMMFLLKVRDYRLLPETYIYGVITLLYREAVRPGFLLGEFKKGGWWYYFPAALLFKAALPTLIFLAVGVVLAIREFVRRRFEPIGPGLMIPAAAGAVIFAAAAMRSPMNIGLRHIVPAYVSLLILAAPAVGVFLRRRRWGLLAASGGALWLFACTLTASPNFLSYFNSAVGGAKNGHYFLADSNIDWGQGLPDLVDDPGVQSGETVMFFYHGLDDPTEYGLDIPWSNTNSQFPESWRPGRYAVSVNLIRGIGLALGEAWTKEHLDDYLVLTTLDEAGAMTGEDIISFKKLQVHRVITRLRERKPDGMIGDSFLTYDIAADEFQRILAP